MSRTIEVDVVVVGGGGSGLCAAISAREAGARVLLLEKNPILGGTTRLSVGSITATNTSWQKRKGIVDSRDAHFEDMDKFLGPLAGRDNLELRRLLVDNITDTLEWLKSIGVAFFGPMPEPPHRTPRMHNVLPNSRAYPYHLGREAKRVGVDIRTNAKVGKLVQDSGRVAGVDATIDGESVRVLARRGVILASGDISAAEDFRRQYRPDLLPLPAMNPTSTGDGQRMAVALGASVRNGDVFRGPALRLKAPAKDNLMRRLPPWGWLTSLMLFALDHLPMWMLRPFIMSFMTSSMAPEPTMFRLGAVLVNMQGERFTDEVGATVGADIGRQAEQAAWLVFDERVARKFSAWPNFVSTAPGLAYAYVDDYRRTRPDLYRKAATLDALARGMNVPVDAFQRAIDSHNGQLGARTSRVAGDERAPLVQGPFHAIGPVHSWVLLADGGLAVDTQLRVLGADNQPIAGLYAAGSAGQGGALLSGHGHHIGWAMTSGRLAGRIAAQAS